MKREGSTQIGGYGELHYNNLDGAGGAPDKTEVDFHRFVLFFGHQFNDRIRLFSELELEHAVSGEVRMEKSSSSRPTSKWISTPSIGSLPACS